MLTDQILGALAWQYFAPRRGAPKIPVMILLYSVFDWRYSLLFGVENSQKNGPRPGVCLASETAPAARNSGKIPVIFPVSRDFGVETGSLTTAFPAKLAS